MNQYQRGATWERDVRAHLEERGYDVIRSAGSKGKVDLVAFNDDEVLFVQCKIKDGLTSPAERAELIRQARRAMAKPIVAFKVKEKGRVRHTYRLLTDVGPRAYVPWVPMTDIDHEGCEGPWRSS